MDNRDEITDSDESEQEEEEDLNSEDETFLLSELSELNRRVTEKNVKVAEKMVAKGGLKTTFTVGQFVTLAIPPKNRLLTEGSRLPCRIVKSVRGAYALLCIYGLLRGLHQGSTLKAVLDGVTFNIPETVPPKVKKLTLPQAVTLSNNRKSIAAQQKEGAAATQARREAQAARREHDAAVAVAVQDDLDEQFAREVEAAVQKRGEDILRPIGKEGSGRGAGVTTPTPVMRNKRVRKAMEKWEPPIKAPKR